MGASAGRVLLIPKGNWNASTTYTGLDWVRHNGAAWVCKNTCTNIEPTEANSANWQMMARDGDGVTADTAMSDTSTNAVQNKVIKSYVDNSITRISDMTGATSTENGTHGLVPAPQAGDEKKVLLGDGTWGAIDDKFSFSDHDTATSGTSFTDAEDGNMIVTDWTKNLLNPTLQTTTTQNGVTCTNNGDGTYTLNGTATAWTNFYLNKIYFENGKKYKMIGCVGGSSDTYYLSYDKSPWYICVNENGAIIEGTGEEVQIIIACKPNSVLNNIVFKPMLTTDLSATYDDFVPYGGYEIQSCGKNLVDILKCNYYCNAGASYAINGETLEINCAASASSGIYTYDMYKYFTENIGGKIKISFDAKITIGGYVMLGAEKNTVNINIGTEYERKVVEFTILNKPNALIIYNYSGVAKTLYIKNFIIEKVDEFDGIPTEYEPYTGETITVTNNTESPAFGLKSHKGITNIISPGNVKCVYPTNESGKGVLDAMYNNELSKRKNAILTYKTKEEYDAAVANDKIPDGATVIKDYDD